MEPAYDVFLSYARSDSARAALVREKLEALRLSVFFDAEGIDSGEEFPAVIDREVKSAKCVLALWSAAALSRRWVRIESRIGLDQNKLVAVMLDGTQPEELPAEFYNVNFERLADFTGDESHPGWRRVLRAIGNRTGRRDLAASAAPNPPPPARTPAAANVPGWALGLGLIGAGALVLLLMPRDRQPALEPAPAAAMSPADTFAQQSAQSLSGAWRGEYWAASGARTPFTLTLTEAGGAFNGSLSEENTFVIGGASTLNAIVSGAIQADGRVSFSKTYDGASGVAHTVQYEGQADASRRVITGTWRVASRTGEFRMER